MTPNNVYRTLSFVVLVIIIHFREHVSGIIFYPLALTCTGIYFYTLRREYLQLAPSDQQEYRFMGVIVGIIGLIATGLILFV
ncbi:MAG: hypothetical protein JNK69_08330 [Saprospiraceae bacterium]|nr:hypothetical protein [Candidatus Vicinibacter proximus]MBL7823400.1 hypothetical protein [Saprospiraceae bacterium]MCC6842431.1 hypothetical protein [Saprospiraceae bacterium]HRG32258.1 hypothetical protein [Saprospiraceae bacterium]